jgi:hypothetical protein
MKESTHEDFLPSLIVACCFFALMWWKKRSQFGRSVPVARVYVNDLPLHCLVCGGQTFRKREGLVNTSWLTVFQLDPWNESAHCVSCLRCGYTHWFMSRATADSGRESPNAWIRYEVPTRNK